MLKMNERQQIQNRISQMGDSVKLMLFTQKLAGACQFCTQTEQLLKEVSELSDKLEFEGALPENLFTEHILNVIKEN